MTQLMILDQVAQYLEFQIDSGVKTASVSPEVIAALSTQTRTGSSVRRSSCAALTPAPRPVAPRPVAPVLAPTSCVSSVGATSELGRMADRIAACRLCSLHQERTRTVPGQGCPAPEILFVGEAPGAEEDKQGLAFVGAAGQLLTKMIEAMGYTRDQIFIANILKCRPPNNRPPLPEEMATCLPYLREQIGILKPKVIVALGATAVRGLLTVETKISALRGHWFTFEGIDLMPTFHPAYLLRNPSAKREAWDDLKAVLTKLGRTAPPGKKPMP